MKKIKKAAAPVLFTALLISILWCAFHVFGFQDDSHTKAALSHFYTLPDNCLDAVWIGPSSVSECIIPSEVYSQSGAAIYSLSYSGEMPFDALPYLIAECEKTQNPELYLIDIRDLTYPSLNEIAIRRVTDNMKWSLNRVRTIQGMLADLNQYHPEEKLNSFDLYFSFTKYHSRWTALEKTDFSPDEDSYLGYWPDDQYDLFDKTDVLSRREATEQPISEENNDFLLRFLDYCDSFDKQVVFTCTPNCLKESMFGQYNYCKRIIMERGYEVWDLNDDVDEIGLDYCADFKDYMHTNIWGAQKVSSYVASQLSEQYHFIDHRGDPEYLVFEETASRLNRWIQEAQLRAEEELEPYLTQLSAFRDDCDLYFAVNGSACQGLSADAVEILQNLGLGSASCLRESQPVSYLAILSQGTFVYESADLTGESVSFYGSIGNMEVYAGSSAGASNASVVKGKIETAVNKPGLNIVVIHHTTGEVVDSVAFTIQDDKTACVR